MKKSFFWGIVTMMSVACSHIDEDERLIYVQPAEVQRAVLIEDFTGQACVNCPAATAQIHELQQAYGEDNVIAVAIHSGPFAHRRSMMSNPFLSDLGTANGDNYYTHWGIEAQPGVKINRGAPIYDIRQYASAVAAEMQKTAPINFEDVVATLANGTVSVRIEPSIPTADINARLQVWIVEDSINAAGGNRTYQQQMPDNVIDVDYVHNHVFRASMTNDLYGDSYVHGALEKRLDVFTYSHEVESTWNTDQLSVVVFLWNEQEGVLQVRRVKVTN